MAWRWQILLRGQGIQLGFGYLTSTYFIGRYFGIVTPSTMGLDAWRLYETIRLTRRPVECTTVLAVERVLGLVGLFTVIATLGAPLEVSAANLAIEAFLPADAASAARLRGLADARPTSA